MPVSQYVGGLKLSFNVDMEINLGQFAFNDTGFDNDIE